MFALVALRLRNTISSRKAKSESYIRGCANRADLSVFVTTRESLIFRSFHDTSRDSLDSFVTSTARSRCLLSDRMSSAAAGRSGNSRRSAHLSCFHKVCKIYPFDGKADQHASKMSQSMDGYRLR